MTMYKKRPGASGIRGHLYETKLTSLIYFRAKHNDHIEEFHLATNVDEIGAFDDICFKAKFKDSDKPVAVFIQAKHRENNKIITLNNRKDLTKLFNSYMTIRRAFEPNKKDVLFEGNFNETECLFVWYTNEKGDPNCNTYNGSYAHILNNIIGTGESGTQPSYKPEDVQFLYKLVLTEQITELGVHIAKFICDEADCEMSMNDDLILRFHVILAQKVFEVSEVQPEGYRIASFRHEFFDSKDELLALLKDIIYTNVSRIQKLDDVDINAELSKYLQEPTDSKTLSKLIGKVLIYRNNRLELVKKITTDEGIIQQIYNVHVLEKTVHEAVDIAAKDTLTSGKLKVLKVPAAFGNKDLTIRGNEAKVEKRLNHITKKLVDLIEKSKPHNIVTIDDSLEKGFLQLNGGIGGTIGNMLVFDDDTTFLKFTNNSENVGDISKRLYIKLKNEVENLQEYRFKVNVKNFPKLSFVSCEYEQNLTKDFFDKLLFYTNQANENGVEEVLKHEIESRQSHEHDVNNLRIKSDAIFLKYHTEIQKWWMNPEEASYLTKQSVIYENTLNDIIEETFTLFNNLCSDAEESVESDTTDMTSQGEREGEVNEIPKQTKDKKAFFPAKLKHKLKMLMGAVAVPEASTSRDPYVEEKERTKVVVAIYPYKAKESGKLSLNKGAEYEIVDNTQSCWWQVKDKHGSIGYIPRTCVMDKEIMECQKYEWFVGEMSKQRAEHLLSPINTFGVLIPFLVHYTSTKTSLTLTTSLYKGKKVLHYDIQQNSRGEFFCTHVDRSRCFASVPELIEHIYIRYGSRLTSVSSQLSTFIKWDIDPSELILHETIDTGDKHVIVRRGKWREFIDTNVGEMSPYKMYSSYEELLDQFNIMTKLEHQHLAQIYGVCFRDSTAYIVTEYMQNGSLYNYLVQSDHIETSTLLDICIQVCKGMTYLEQNNCVHRSVSVSNCFLGEDNIVKLSNLGKTRCTLEDQYIASYDKIRIRLSPPEVLNNYMYSSKSDVRSFGVLMWEVFNRCEIPYHGKTNQEVRAMVVKGQVLMQPSGCSDEIYVVMRSCWKFLPSRRPTFSTLLDCLTSIAVTLQGQESCLGDQGTK